MTYHFVPIDARNWPWIKEHAGVLQVEDTTGVGMINDQGQPVAACVMDSWTATACNLHILIQDPLVLRHGFLEEIFWYVFEVNEMDMVWGFTPANNEKALKFIKHVGMEEQYRMPNAYRPGVDYVVSRMLREDCRWVAKLTQRPIEKKSVSMVA